jgi:molybdate transport system regulatory protein
MKPEIRFHIVDQDHRTPLGIGPGKVALLEAIADTGSITSAARKLNMSYRRAWLLVDETNRCLLHPAVETASGGQKGGGTVLSPDGLELVQRYRAVERETEKAVARSLKPMLRAIPDAVSGKRTR